jgi:threonine/homoserine/homoserine lactone efflux protein
MIAPLVKQLLINGMMTQTAARGVRRGSAWLGYAVLAGAIGLIGVVFLSLAGYSYLMETYSATLSALITGGILIGLSMIVVFTGYTIMTKGKAVKAAVKPNNGLMDTVENTIQSFMDGLEEPVRDNPKMAMLLAALAGFAAGDKLGDNVH